MLPEKSTSILPTGRGSLRTLAERALGHFGKLYDVAREEAALDAAVISPEPKSFQYVHRTPK